MRTRQTMNVSITPELVLVAAQLTSGRYKNASEVVRAALRLLEDAEGRRRTMRLARPVDDAALHGQ